MPLPSSVSPQPSASAIPAEAAFTLDLRTREGQLAARHWVDCHIGGGVPFQNAPGEAATRGARQQIAAHLEDWLLVASDGDTLAVLTTQGTWGLDAELEALGPDGVLHDLFDVRALPAGLWVVHGRVRHYQHPDTAEGRGDWDVEVDGGGERPATDEDLRLLQIGLDQVLGHAQADGLALPALTPALAAQGLVVGAADWPLPLDEAPSVTRRPAPADVPTQPQTPPAFRLTPRR